MSKEQSNSAPVAIGEIEQGPSKSDQFLEKNQKNLIFLGIGIMILAGGFIVLREMNENKNLEAGAALLDASDASSYQDVASSYEGTPAAGSALLALANTQWEEDKKDDSITTINDFLARYSDHPAYNSTLVSLGSKLNEQGKPDDALPFLVEAEQSEDPTFAPLAQLLIAEIKINKGEQEEAYNILEGIQDLPEEDLGRLGAIVEMRLNAAKSPLPPVVEPAPPVEKEVVAPAVSISPEVNPVVVEPSVEAVETEGATSEATAPEE